MAPWFKFKVFIIVKYIRFGLMIEKIPMLLVNTKFLLYILVYIWTKHIMKLILINFAQLNLLVFKFRNLIQS